MQLDPSTVDVPVFYRHMIGLITPRPIAWVSTLSKLQVPNLAPYSFFNGVGCNPPTVVFCPVNRRDGSKKDTLLNIEETGEFVVNIVSHSAVPQMHQTSADYDRDTSEFQAVGLTTRPSECIAPARVAESFAQFECKLHFVMQLAAGPGASNLVVGRIVRMHVDDSVLGDDGFPDPEKLDTVGRMGGDAYTRTRDRFEIPRPKLQ